MIRRSTLPVLVTVALLFAACGGGSDEASSSDDTTSQVATSLTDVDDENANAEATEPAPTSEPSSESDAVESEAGPGADTSPDCSTALTVEEVDALFNTAAEITGAGSFCNIILRDDAVAGFNAFTDDQADEALAIQSERFEQFAITSSTGVTLPDDRGFVFDGKAIVRADSGTVYLFSIGELGDIDTQATLESLAELLIVR